MEDRGRVGESTRFDHNAIELRASAFITPAQQVLQGLGQVGANLAAQTAGGERNDAVFTRFDQLVIERNFAEFVDHDSGARKLGLTEQMAEYCSLATAEKAGKH
jgi:hypothetical protein